MKTWKTILLSPFVRIARHVGTFELTDLRHLPNGTCKIKVLEYADGAFAAFPNVAVREVEGAINWTCGLGPTLEIALEDAIKNLGASFEGKLYAESELEWSDPRDF